MFPILAVRQYRDSQQNVSMDTSFRFPETKNGAKGPVLKYVKRSYLTAMTSGFPSGSPLTVPPLRGIPQSNNPHTWGEAIEVPLMVLYPPSFQVDLIETPGAQ